MEPASQASWHPAFMPNSTAEAAALNAPESLDSSPQPAPDPSLEYESDAPAPASFTDEVQGADGTGNVDEETQGNDAHPELGDLRDALTTSLASPGGVELDENLWHQSAEETPTMDQERGDFPSNGPHDASKRMSTLSFARTVSEEVGWGEEDDVDSQWNMQSPDNDPFKSMVQTDRTNSFPAVPPAPSTGFNSYGQQLAHSQAEDIMNGVEQELAEDLFQEKENVPVTEPSVHSPTKPEGFQYFTQHEEVDDSELQLPDYGQTYGGNVRPEEDQDAEARFAEGLPLVQHENEYMPTQSSITSDPFATADANEEDFFAQVNKVNNEAEASIVPPPLERKSTTQVLDSLHYQTHAQTHQAIAEEGAIESSNVSVEPSTGGGVAALSSTVLSPGLGDTEAVTHDQSEPLDADEGDLAAKWEAALAGDEFLADDDDELLPDDDEPTETAGFDPAAIFGSDDEGFLDDNDETTNAVVSQKANPPLPAPGFNGHMAGSLTGTAQRSSSSSNQYIPAGATTAPALVSRNSYAPVAPLLTDLSQPKGPTGVPSPYMSPSISNFQSMPARPEISKAQSFSDKAKGGYASPYDLPMDVVKPRKRVSTQQMNRTPQTPADMAPPRSSSMYHTLPRGPSSSLPPPTSSHAQQSQLPPGIAQQPQPPLPPTVKKTQSGFFEELPMSRPKPTSRHTSGLASPALGPYGHPGAVPPMGTGRSPYAPPPTQQPPNQPQPAQQHLAQPPLQTQGLVTPARVSPYAPLPTGNAPMPAISSRYSPAPPPLQHSQTAPPPAAPSRYSPAPPGQRSGSYASVPPVSAQPPQPVPVLAHQPRTSSPLAHFERNHEARSHSSSSEAANLSRRTSYSGYESSTRSQQLPPTREVEESSQFSPTSQRNYGELQNQYGQQAQPPVARQTSTPPPPHGLASRLVSSPSKRATSNYQPQPAGHGPPQPFLPPKRSQTQSPGTGLAGPRPEMTATAPYQRPASVEVPPSPRANNSYQSMSAVASAGRPREFSAGLPYVTPTDGRENDPLQRWRGAPVFAWGVGGTIITSLPQDIPRYGMNAQAMIIRSPGTVKIRSIKDIDPLQERLTSFPGPLKGKSKKKDVLAWLTSGIDFLEQNASYLRTVQTLSHEDKRIEERILLWKILRVFIEHDGTLEGNAVVDKAVRSVLSPGLDEQGTSAPLYATGAELSGIQPSINTATRADPVDPAAVDQLRKHLLRGDREKAVWDAVDKRLWAHAMLISNTVSKDLYKRVAQEFIQKEVKIIGDNVEPLAALYEIFAGNFEESIDELVPPSARAGFQMVSTSNAIGPSKDATDGLDRWRETLGLVLSNRSADDSQALNAMGKLLSGYGRAEAAHICFLFARNLSIFGGIDDPQASIVLVGSDHLRQPHDFDRELEPVLLSEVFEYGTSLSSNSTIAISSPHLAIYKLQHAKILAEYGFRDKALQYCDAITASITSQTRRSPYYHAFLVSGVDDLSKRLKQSPKDETSSWISKPSMDKAKGSVWATFNKFVAGDEADASASVSSATNAPDIGPFSRIAGGTPIMSRVPSVADMYGAQNSGIGINGSVPAPTTKASSRYAPGPSSYGNHDMSSGPSYGSQPRTSLDERPSGEFRRYEPQREMYTPVSQTVSRQPSNQGNSYAPQNSSSYTPFGNSGSSYEPSPTFASQTPVTEQPPPNTNGPHQPLSSFDGQQPSPYTTSKPSSLQQPASSSDSPALNNFDPPSRDSEPTASNGYEAPSWEPQGSVYEPPSSGYVPYEPNDEPDSPVEAKPKKKSFMDDDEDDIPGLQAVPASREKTKAEKDREADEAFRKAAEADAQKDKEAAPVKRGWGFGGGWFGGGGKKESQDMGAAPNKPIKAKLGEASSFYYDPELKRWINKKGGAEDMQARSATPPPPKAAGPPRTASAPMQPSQDSTNPAAGPSTSAPRPMPIGGAPQMLAQRAVSDFTHMGLPPSPQSDDGGGSLNAAPLMNRSQSNGNLRTSRPPSAPPSRPGTGMSNASSIDDLLGPAMPRKAGAKGAKKKGRGYVDVMSDKAS
ncbi:uncharacterized protein L3040_008477 [Drepanopeziza brunnea f. sp. 'multigermtubi']|uniref:uncharacterized protein n=1 Tax=Drepanopeziza brunnea f. sp. 'multigermtubi' TaxID=698441 RepID=UPI00238974D1|nr:hypothetical protein L3040_008477 [Drepanopeziza brunnea f. sp. 'multigermtubi']